MCGRFVQTIELKEAGAIFKALVEAAMQPNYNVAPRQSVAVVMEDGERKIVAMQWGLIPHWAKDASIANKLINARSDGLIPPLRTGHGLSDCLNRRGPALFLYNRFQA